MYYTRICVQCELLSMIHQFYRHLLSSLPVENLIKQIRARIQTHSVPFSYLCQASVCQYGEHEMLTEAVNIRSTQIRQISRAILIVICIGSIFLGLSLIQSRAKMAKTLLSVDFEVFGRVQGIVLCFCSFSN